MLLVWSAFVSGGQVLLLDRLLTATFLTDGALRDMSKVNIVTAAAIPKISKKLWALCKL